MHKSSYVMMHDLVNSLEERAFFELGMRVLDCGSAVADTGMQVSYRELFKDMDVDYIGFDATLGVNVDLVGNIYELASEPKVDLLISGQMLEHLTFPLLAAQRMKDAVREGGWMILIAPWQYGIHRYPIDCWRVLPDGMKFLFEGFEQVETGVQANDCWGIGRKPVGYKAPWIISRS